MKQAYIKRFQGGCYEVNVVGMKVEPTTGLVQIVDDAGAIWEVHLCNVVTYDEGARECDKIDIVGKSKKDDLQEVLDFDKWLEAIGKAYKMVHKELSNKVQEIIREEGNKNEES